MATTISYRSRPSTNSSNGIGTAGLVLGIISAVFCLIPLVGLFGGPLAVIGAALSSVGLWRASKGGASNLGSAVAGLILSLLALAACAVWITFIAVADSSTSTDTSDSAPVAVAKEEPRKSDPEPDNNGGAALGTAVTIDDFAGVGRADIVIDKIDLTPTSTNEFITPGPGNKYVAAHVTVKNTGKSTYSNVSWIGAKVYTERGQAYTSDLVAESSAGPALPSSIDLKPGGEIDGWVMFEVPADSTVKTVTFDDAEWAA